MLWTSDHMLRHAMERTDLAIAHLAWDGDLAGLLPRVVVEAPPSDPDHLASRRVVVDGVPVWSGRWEARGYVLTWAERWLADPERFTTRAA